MLAATESFFAILTYVRFVLVGKFLGNLPQWFSKVIRVAKTSSSLGEAFGCKKLPQKWLAVFCHILDLPLCTQVDA
jgi:hypothetical protein